jgi:hypothetical protein
MKDGITKVSYAVVEAAIWFSLALPLVVAILD